MRAVCCWFWSLHRVLRRHSIGSFYRLFRVQTGQCLTTRLKNEVPFFTIHEMDLKICRNKKTRMVPDCGGTGFAHCNNQRGAERHNCATLWHILFHLLIKWWGNLCLEIFHSYPPSLELLHIYLFLFTFTSFNPLSHIPYLSLSSVFLIVISLLCPHFVSFKQSCKYFSILV